MKIQSVRIKNFRALKDVTIPFDSVTTFIGPNGAGKSTVLHALDWFFNGKPGSLTEKDCSFGEASEDIEVQVTFADLTEKDREALGKYTPEGAATFTAWKRRSADGTDVLSANAKGFPEFNVIKTANQEIAAIVEESRAKQQKVYEEKFQAQLEVLTTQLNEVVSSYSPGRAVTVSPAEVELKAPKTTFEVTVLDGTAETAVERQGHGFQRTILISALQLLAQSGSASADGVICLAIEEPELFQHPIQAQAFAKVLRSLVEDPDKCIQVTYATHSPYFLEARHFDQVRRLTRSSDETPVVSVHYATVADVKAKLDGIVSADVVDRRLDHNVADQLSIALFANLAFLVEGSTESAIFYGIGDRTSHGLLEAAGVSIVSVGSKTSIPLAHAILSAIGVPAYALFDADAGFEVRAKAKNKKQEDIDKERNNHAAENRKLLRYFDIPEEDFPEAVVGDTVAIFEDHLESFLVANWPEWLAACSEIEIATGISLSKNQLAYRTATLKSAGAVPEMLQQILAKVEGK
ncbi:ATP-dependent nuclease [Escherichia coli]